MTRNVSVSFKAPVGGIEVKYDVKTLLGGTHKAKWEIECGPCRIYSIEKLKQYHAFLAMAGSIVHRLDTVELEKESEQ